MLKLIAMLGIAVGLSAALTGCVVAPPYGYAPAPGYGYAYAPGYVVAPSVGIAVGGGWHGR